MKQPSGRGRYLLPRGDRAGKRSHVSSGRGERVALLAALCCLILAAAIVALATVRLLDARRYLLAGARDLRQARAVLHGGLVTGGTARAVAARRALVAGQSQIGQARSELAPWSPIVVHLDWVPMIGDQLAAAPPIADASLDATRSAIALLDGLLPAISSLDPGTHRHDVLTRIGYALRQSRPRFIVAAVDASRAGRDVTRVPTRLSNRSLAAAARELRQNVPLLLGAARWLLAAPALLGSEGPSHYVVLLQNPANIAPTGGMIGAVDYLTLDRGSSRSDFASSALPHQIDSVSAPLPEQIYSPIAYWTLLDSNWSPDFPLSARIARWFYGEDTGRWGDGVIGLLDTGIVRILAGTGPVYVPAYGRWIDAGNIEALSQQYVNGHYHGPSGAGSSDTVRKQFLGDVVRALVDRIQTLPSARWPALGQALQDAIATREVQLYDRRSAVESAIRTAGADGGLRATPGDFLALVDFNESDNKLNPYVQESADYRVNVGPDLGLDAVLTIHYHVAPSPADLEGVGPVFGNVGTKHDYEDFLRVYVPYGSRLMGMSGLQPWAPLPAYGMTQFGGRFLVREGQSRTVVIRYRVPPAAFARTSSSRYSLTVRRQPGANLSTFQVRVTGRAQVTLTSGGIRTLTRTLSLPRDAHLAVALRGASRPLGVSPARASGPPDPYIPFGDFRDPKHPL